MVPKYLSAENLANENVAPVRLNFRLIRGRSAAAGTARLSSVVPGHARPPTATQRPATDLEKRVGETLKSSNLLSSASELTCGR
jgi:hypothetical protein